MYAETIPPKDPLAIRTDYNALSGNPPNVPPLQLSDMQAAVNGAAQNGGGWIIFTFHEICDQTWTRRTTPTVSRTGGRRS